MINTITVGLSEEFWGPKTCEFEMLYGVRRSLQKQLVADGYRVRLYLPFGSDWWPYTARRIGENPKNARFAFQSIFCKS